MAGILGMDAYVNGLTRVALRTETFKAAVSQYGDEVAQSLVSTYFANDATLNSVLGPMGYVVGSGQVKVAG